MNSLKKLVIKPTIYCFHNCPYCDERQEYYQGVKKTSEKGHMCLDMAKDTIRRAHAMGMESCLIGGGDPLLYPHLEELVLYAKSFKDVFVFINSTGNGLTEEKAYRLVSAGLGCWNISLDSPDYQEHDKIRGVKGAWAESVRAIRLLTSLKHSDSKFSEFNINLMTVMTRQNFRNLPRLVSFALENEISAMWLMNVYGADSASPYYLNKDEINEFKEIIVPGVVKIFEVMSTEEVVKENAKQVMGSFFDFETNTIENYEKGIYWNDSELIYNKCQMPNYYALVEANGKVLPCCMPEIAHNGEVGVIDNNKSISDVWGSEEFNNFRKNRMSFCQRCPSPRHRTLGLIPSMCQQFI